MQGDDLMVPGGERLIGLVLIVFAVLLVLTVGFIIAAADTRYRAAKPAGLDLFAADVQLLSAGLH